MPDLASSASTPRRSPTSGSDGVVSVFSVSTSPDTASSRTTSVKVPPMSTASRQSPIAIVLAWRRKDVRNPAFAVLGVADEPAIAVIAPLGCPVHVTGSEHVVFAVDPEVQLTAEDDAELLVVRMV